MNFIKNIVYIMNDSNVKYTFVNKHTYNTQNKVNDDYIYYFQVATYIHPFKNGYHVKRHTVDSENNLINVKDYYINKKQMNKLIKKYPNKFKFYSVYELDDISIPKLGDINTARSELLSSNYSYSGFAPV